MSGLRSLLRLDDKVAAEGRRLQRVGGPSVGWLVPLTLVAAATLHVAILLLPTVTTRASLPLASRVPEFPLVWRNAPPPLPPPLPPPTAPASPTATPVTAGSAPSRVAQSPPPPAAIVGAMTIEPVPEPDPDLLIGRISANVEAIIPPPDAAPDSLDPGPPSGAAGTPAESTPPPIRQVSPVYPEAARSMRAEGRVAVSLTVLPDGTVGTATVETCTRPGLGFEAAALAAVKRWRYEPVPEAEGVRRVSVTIHFQKQDGRP